MFANQHETLAMIAKDVREVAKQFQTISLAASQEEFSACSRNCKSIRTRQQFTQKKMFDDHEWDVFLEDCYEYIVRFFAGSLEELERRNPNIKIQL